LGGEVRFEGALPVTMSLSVTELPVAAVLDQVSAAVKGKWERAYRLSRNETAGAAAPVRTGLKVTLRLENLPCATVAAIVARMSGARIEADGEIEGTVTISGADMPVEEAMDAIARAAGMTWRPVYVIHGHYVPPSAPISPGAPEASGTRNSGNTSETEPSAATPRKRARPKDKKRPSRT
jgi:hypothetical protein